MRRTELGPIPIPRRTEHLCGITIKGKWQRDALRPGIRLFQESHPQKAAQIWAQIWVHSFASGAQIVGYFSMSQGPSNSAQRQKGRCSRALSKLGLVSLAAQFAGAG